MSLYVPSSVYSHLHSPVLQILANFGFLCSLLFGRVLQKIFFGTLQPREVEVRRPQLSVLSEGRSIRSYSLAPL